MCFSASASFIASAALMSIGTVAIVKKRGTPDWPLVAIPFIFAVQQAIEGFLWLSLKNWGGQGSIFLSSLFLFFAFFWWPAYMPTVTAYLEKNKTLRGRFKVLAFLGITFGAALYAFYILHPQPPYLLNHSVCYNYYPYDFSLGLSTYPLLLVLYFAFTFIPGLFSSHRVFRLFCVLSALSAGVALYFYTEHFTSVWCFFAAILSLVTLWQPKNPNKT